jgi:hypothetical protein
MVKNEVLFVFKLNKLSAGIKQRHRKPRVDFFLIVFEKVQNVVEQQREIELNIFVFFLLKKQSNLMKLYLFYFVLNFHQIIMLFHLSFHLFHQILGFLFL